MGARTALARAVERAWWGAGGGAAAARSVLAPLELVYRTAVGVRGALYDRGALRVHDVDLPAVSVGNLSVGGTGKTPVAAWLAGELRARGARPAIVLRGYGSDEPLVHATLNPEVPVIVTGDRVAGVARAAFLECDVAVLDDAFQHRRARRAEDVVLVSADRWTGRVRLLPAGPWREPLGALRRASLALVTRKAAGDGCVDEVLRRVAAAAPGLPAGVVRLAAEELRAAVGSGRLPMTELRGAQVLAVCAVGDPLAFLEQLREAGATVDAAVFPDHHAFGEGDAASLADRAARADLAVCTLKDAVKLAPQWPRGAAPLWYVSQLVRVERGGREVDAVLDRVLRARPRAT